MGFVEREAVSEEEIAAAILEAGPLDSHPVACPLFVHAPGARAGRMSYHRCGHGLTVYSGPSQVDSAVYRFDRAGQPLAELAALRVEDWARACVASPAGPTYQVWSPHTAAESIRAILWAAGIDAASLHGRYPTPTIGTSGQWADWLNLYGAEWLGHLAPGDFCAIGYRPSNALRWHLFGLRAALRRLGEIQ